jgi:hypothetical protein
MNRIGLIIFFLPTINSFCEAQWSNISNENDPRELINAITSLSYTAFGCIGLMCRNATSLYYLVMNLFILTGLSSFLHHYYYTIGSWTHVADIICMYLLTVFSLFYIVCDNEYAISRYIKISFNLLITFSNVTLITMFHINHQERYNIFKIIIGEILTTQIMLCLYFIYINFHIKRLVILTFAWNSILFTLGIIMWHLDTECTSWIQKSRFNGHSIWHISISWSLFNSIAITNLARYNYNKIKTIWKPLFSCMPGFLYIILITNERSNTKHNGTSIDVEEIKLLVHNNNNHHHHHRRIKSSG